MTSDRSLDERASVPRYARYVFIVLLVMINLIIATNLLF